MEGFMAWLALAATVGITLASYGVMLLLFLWARAAGRRTARLTTFRKVL